MPLALAVAGCPADPAGLRFGAGQASWTITDVGNHPLPSVSIVDDEGNVLQDGVDAQFSFSPGDVAVLIGDKLSVTSSGAGTLRAVLDDPPLSAELPVRVSLVSGARIVCPKDPCALDGDDELQLSVRIDGDPTADVKPAYSSSDESVFTVTPTGRVTAVSAGTAKVIAKVRDVETALEIRVLAKPDEIAVRCGDRVFRTRRSAKGSPCPLGTGETLDLAVRSWLNGTIIAGPTPALSSTMRTTLDVSGLRLSGVKRGVAGVRVDIDPMQLTVPVDVGERFQKLAARGYGKGSREVRALACSNPDGKGRMTLQGFGKRGANDDDDDAWTPTPHPVRCETAKAASCLRTASGRARTWDEVEQAAEACCCQL